MYYSPDPLTFWVLLWLFIKFRGDTDEARAAAREAAERWTPLVHCGCLVVVSIMAVIGLLIIGVVIAAFIAPDTVNGFFDWLEVRWNMPFRINFPF